MKEDPSAPQVELRKQPFAAPEKVQEVMAETYRNLKNRKATIQTSMALYLANKDTEYILFKPIKVREKICNLSITSCWGGSHIAFAGVLQIEERNIFARMCVYYDAFCFKPLVFHQVTFLLPLCERKPINI